MTALEVCDLVTRGGARHFARVIAACESFGPYCLIGGLAVNCYVEPVYTFDVGFVVTAPRLPELMADLARRDSPPESDLRIQFTTDQRYQAFLSRAVESDVLGIRVRIACLADVTQGKLWAYADPRRRLSKRTKDELDLIRLAESFPDLKAMYPVELRELLDRG